MKPPLSSLNWKRFGLQIVFPVFLVGILFILAIFEFLIPAMEKQLMERKKETIRELTLAAWSILDSYHQETLVGDLSQEEAQREAAARIGALRYGSQGKDYFWITDMLPTMIIHPYRSDLNGQDLRQFKDSSGKRIFVEFVNAVQDTGAGYVDYYWQWQDDPSQIVQKLSYVKAFEPWGWVIGTGIYIEDVKQEINRIERNVILASAGISTLMIIILFFILRGSLMIEQQRTRAEEELRESHEKYRALVESTVEGALMVLQGKCTFANRALLDLLGYQVEELSGLEISKLFAQETRADQQVLDRINLLIKGEATPKQFEARLRRKDGNLINMLLTTTRVSFADQEGFVLVARDLSYQKEAEAVLGESNRQAKTLTRAIPLGIFRSTWDKKTRLLEANPAMRSLFDLKIETDLDGFDWLERIFNPQERSDLVGLLQAEGQVQDLHLKMTAGGGQVVDISCFAMLIQEEPDRIYCDGVLQNISEQIKAEGDRDALLAQLQTSQIHLEEPLSNVMSKAITCEMTLPIQQAAHKMTQAGVSAIVVCGSGGEPLGIITDHDFRERVIAVKLDPGRPAYEIISAPLQTISEHALVYEAILLLQEKEVSCLAVKDDSGQLKGIVRHIDLVQYRQHAAMILTHTIRNASTVEQIREAYHRLPRLVGSLIQSGTKVRHINRMISSIADTISQRLIALAIMQLGEPPVRFAFLSLGSEGREEQTLVTDQDNALLYEDPPEQAAESVHSYFLALGTLVCDWLDQVGYVYCKGGIMAKNARWTMPLSAWKESFYGWIHNANPQELLELNMAFDFRCVSGDEEIVQTLRSYVFHEIKAYPPFLLHFAQNALIYRTPLGVFGNILVEPAGQGDKALNLKEAMLPMVNYARLYALKHEIDNTHTLDRLSRLHEKGLLSRELIEDLKPAYEALMRMRLDRQSAALLANRPPNNLIRPEEWTPLEEVMLKKTFAILGSLRKKISYDFLGVA
jgi:PAS domain S-box-containing protein